VCVCMDSARKVTFLGAKVRWQLARLTAQCQTKGQMSSRGYALNPGWQAHVTTANKREISKLQVSLLNLFFDGLQWS